MKMLRNWRELVRNYGPLYLFAYPFNLVRVSRSEKAEGFDLRFGTDTAAVAYPWHLPSLEGEPMRETHAYEAVPAWLIREILESVPLRPNEFAFVDMGAGKGRALLIASEYPFTRVVGVELSEELLRIADENVKKYRPASQKCSAFSLICLNAVDYPFGSEPLVLFLFNPFGRDTLHKILDRLEDSLRAHPREMFVVFANPQFGAEKRSDRFLRRVKYGGFWWRPWERYVIYAANHEEAI